MGNLDQNVNSRCIVNEVDTHVDILLSELLRQTLTQGSDTKLARRERAGKHVPAHAGCSPGEQERPPRSVSVQRVLLECKNCLARERKSRGDMHFERGLDVLLCDGEERPEYVHADVP